MKPRRLYKTTTSTFLLIGLCMSCASSPTSTPVGFFDRAPSFERSPADRDFSDKIDQSLFFESAPPLSTLDSWNQKPDSELDTVFDRHHDKRRLRLDLRRALKVSLQCGNQSCESEIGESPKSCPLDCGRLKVQGSNQSISGFNMGTQCDQVQKVWEPRSVEEAKTLLGKLTREGAKKIRFLGTRHSASSLICTNEHAVLTTGINKIIGIKQGSNGPEVEVESGVLLGDLWDYVASRGYTLGLGYPFLRAATIGGMLSTGSHGSAHGRYGVSSQNIRSLDLVLFDGTEKTLTPNDGDVFRAAAVSLGNLGFVSRFRLRLEKDYRLKASISDFDTTRFINAEKKSLEWGKPCAFDTIAWFFGTPKAVKICWDKTTEAADPGAENVMLVHDVSGFRGKAAKYLLHYAKVYPWMNRLVTSLRYKQVMKDSLFVKKDSQGNEIRSRTVVGPSSQLLLSRNVEGSNPLFNIHDISFAIAESEMYDAIEFIDQYAKAENLSMPMTGVMLRFVESDGSSLLSHVEHRGPGVRYLMLDFFEYRYFNMPKNLQDELNRVRIEFFKRLVSDFKAIPHGAKNDDWIFRHAIDQKVYSTENYRKYFEIRDRLDPNQYFLNPYFEEFRRVYRSNPP